MKLLIGLLLLASAGTAFAAQYTSTASDADYDQACNQARAIASERGRITSGCACESGGKGTICRVQSTEADEPPSTINDARQLIRDNLSCDPHTENCKSNTGNGGAGIRN